MNIFELLAGVALIGILVGAGFYLAHHIHQVANAAARAVTPPAGVVATLPTPIATVVTDASTAAKTAIDNAAAKAS